MRRGSSRRIVGYEVCRLSLLHGPDIALKESSSDKPGGNALRILQELEQVAYIIVENLLVQRSDLSFSEASNIGSGVFGSVYKGEMAIQPSEPGRVVAIKRLFPSSDETVLPDEVIRAIVTLFARPEHTNILRITSYCADSSSSSSTGELLLVFPFVSTGGLDVYLEHNALTDPKKIALATEIAEALLYLHTRSPPIYHGRLHPRNILISDTGHPLLCDYGFSDFTSRFKQVPATVESLRYQSPEAMNGTSSNTSHNDIWSWGCILLLITLGCIPYEDVKDMGGLMERLERKTYPALLDDIDGDARTINLLGMCWTWDPASRLPMTDVVAILTGRPFKFTRVWSVEVETTTKLWDLTTQTIQEHRSTLPDQPYILDISSDDNFCAIGCDDGKVQIWDIKHKEKNRSTRPNPAFDSQCFAIAISPNCEVMATGFLDHGVCVLNVYTLENLAVFNFEWIWSLRFSPDGRYLFAACGDIWKTRCWDMKKIIDGQSESSELHFQEQRSIALSVSGNPTWLISLSYSGGVHAVNLMTESTGSEAQYVGQIPIDSPTRYRVDLSPVSKNGTGYAAALSSNSGELVVCKFASLSHRDAYRF
ncbi:Serine/threonine-protein kinase tnni3k [Tulasnella sp. 403]|nr:Serine/threonine-protein kinase tnni3k [Tulasnella sp. 403]